MTAPIRGHALSRAGFGGAGDGDRVLAALGGDSLGDWVRKTERVLRGYGKRMERLAAALLDTGHVGGREAAAILSGRE